MQKKYKTRKFTYIFSENEDKREKVKEEFSKFIFNLWWWDMKKGLLTFEMLLFIVFIIIIWFVVYANLFHN